MTVMLGVSFKTWWLASSIPIAIAVGVSTILAMPVFVACAAWVFADCKCHRPWWRCLLERHGDDER